MRKYIRVLLAVFCLLTMIVSCSPQGPQVGGLLNRALVGNPSMLNPILSTDSASSLVEDYIYQGLIRYDENLELVGQLASTWDISPDNLQWTFYLRQDVTWHDGQPFTAGDVEFTLATIAFDDDYPGSRWADFERLEEIHVVDDYTIRFILSEPWGSFLTSLRQGILPRHIYDPNLATGADRAPIADMARHPRNWKPVGTGPYVFASWANNQYITLERNADYYDSGPYIETVCLKFYPNTASAIAALERGEVDLVTDIPSELATTLEENLMESHHFYASQEMGYEILGFNLRPSAFDQDRENPWLDRRVRKAVAHALNREQYIEEILEGKGIIMNSPILPRSWAYSPDNAAEYSYDPDAADNLLQQAGWLLDGDGLRYKGDQAFAFQLTLREDNALEVTLAEMIRRDLAAVGLDIQINAVSWRQMLVNLYAGEFHLLLMGLSLSPDPDVYDFFHSTSVEDGFNFGAFTNSELDRILSRGRSTGDIEARRKLYADAQRILTQELPYVFLFSRQLTIAAANELQGLTVSPLGSCRPEGWYFIEINDDTP